MRRSPSFLTVLLGAVLFGTAVATDARAQDVEMLGRRYGTQPPAGYQARMRADRSSFQFRRSWSGSRLDVRSFEAAGGRSSSGPLLGLGPRSGTVQGNFSIPVVLGLFSNSAPTPPFLRPTIQDSYFGPGPGTISDYYDEVSGGRVRLGADVLDWVQVSRPDTAYTVDESGIPFPHPALGGGGAANFVVDALKLQVGVDWGRYDNDGADRIPNSGDDDGYVDVLAVIHPTRGGECGGSGGPDRIWSHRWSLSSAVGAPFITATPVFGGGAGTILIDDYTIQPAIACSGGGLNPIGVFTHELGHAFGLPDLYDTCDDSTCPADAFQHNGVGVWDLMSSGSWQCNNISLPAMPCHLGAWSKAVLGWVDVVTLIPDFDHGTVTLSPVETSGRVYRVDANDGSGEYFLLENRQRVGYDQTLYSEGLLVWHIDPDWVSARWGPNRINANEHLGVWLRQADGLNDLGLKSGRGDAGDPFPGQSGNTAFHAMTNPGATSFNGGPTGLTILDITPVLDDVQFRLLTSFSSVTVRADGAVGTSGIFTVDGTPVDRPSTTFWSAPFAEHTLDAVAGDLVQPGERRPFLEWLDAPSGPRSRVITTPIVDTTYVAQYEGTQYELVIDVAGGVNGVEPGTFVSAPISPGLWFDSGAPVMIEAVPQAGFAFSGWSGALLGQGNPATFTSLAPGVAGADFSLIYDVSSTRVAFPAATELDVQLEVENGTAPHLWSVSAGVLPDGLALSQEGRITGSSLEMGVFDVTLGAVDAIGLPASGAVAFEMAVPIIPIERLTQPLLLSGPMLRPAELEFLNFQGNGTGGYDIGDFRAWLLANPRLPLSANFRSSDTPSIIIIPMRPNPASRLRKERR
jgi:M6 family metalloprotease-like protein